jgi:hypothetical protein
VTTQYIAANLYSEHYDKLPSVSLIVRALSIHMDTGPVYFRLVFSATTSASASLMQLSSCFNYRDLVPNLIRALVAPKISHIPDFFPSLTLKSRVGIIKR